MGWHSLSRSGPSTENVFFFGNLIWVFFSVHPCFFVCKATVIPEDGRQPINAANIPHSIVICSQINPYIFDLSGLNWLSCVAASWLKDKKRFQPFVAKGISCDGRRVFSCSFLSSPCSLMSCISGGPLSHMGIKCYTAVLPFVAWLWLVNLCEMNKLRRWPTVGLPAQFSRCQPIVAKEVFNNYGWGGGMKYFGELRVHKGFEGSQGWCENIMVYST